MNSLAPLRRLFMTSALLSTLSVAQDGTLPNRIVSFPYLKSSPSRCSIGLEAQFLDNESLLLTNPICEKGGRKSSYQYSIADLDGNIRSSIELGESSNHAFVGPPGYLFIRADHQGWLVYDPDLKPKWSVPIPLDEYPGNVELSPSRTAAALSSHLAGSYTKYRWQLFAGEPLTKTGEYTGEIPFPGITDTGTIRPRTPNQPQGATVEPVPREFWFFDNHYQLTRRSSTGADTVLREASWLAPQSRYPPRCSISLSVAGPPKILADCETEVHLPDGFALITHTYLHSRLRYAVYDTTGRLLTEGTYPYLSPPSLSPDGRKLAVTQGKAVVLYDLR